MAINIQGAVYRNLQEQVQKNMDDIKFILEQEGVLNQFGIKVVGQEAEVEDMPTVAEYKEEHEDWEYGDAYAIGTEAPYTLYILTRANGSHASDYWFNIGTFPAKGDKGDQGEDGPPGPPGQNVKWYAVGDSSFIENPHVGDFYVKTGTGSGRGTVYECTSITPYAYWTERLSIKGPTGDDGAPGQPGPQGEQGETGATGPRGNGWYTTNAIIYQDTQTSVEDSTLINVVKVGDILISNNNGSNGYYASVVAINTPYIRVNYLGDLTSHVSDIAWGNITGSLANQTDLMARFEADEADIAEKTTVSAAYAGTSTNEVKYITIDNTEYKLAGSEGQTYTAGSGITISNNEISVNTNTIQPKLTAGANITISDNTISATGPSENAIEVITLTGNSGTLTDEQYNKIINGKAIVKNNGSTYTTLDYDSDYGVYYLTTIGYSWLDTTSWRTTLGVIRIVASTKQWGYFTSPPREIKKLSGTNDGTNWTTITIGNETKAIPAGGGSTYTAGDGIDITDDEISVKTGTGIFFDSNDAVALNAGTQASLAKADNAVRYNEIQSLTGVQAIQARENIKINVVTALPANPDENTIYLVTGE